MYYRFNQILLIFTLILPIFFEIIDGFDVAYKQQSFEYHVQPTYHSIFPEMIDVTTFLENKIVLDKYFKCWMDLERCPIVGTKIKEILPELIGSDCDKCSNRQKELRDTICIFLLTNHPDMFEALAKKYDPNKIYLTQFYDRQPNVIPL